VAASTKEDHRHADTLSFGIDLGKTSFHLVVLGTAGKVHLRKKFTQKQLLTFTANMQTSRSMVCAAVAEVGSRGICRRRGADSCKLCAEAEAGSSRRKAHTKLLDEGGAEDKC
jgi:hypothetical protein